MVKAAFLHSPGELAADRVIVDVDCSDHFYEFMIAPRILIAILPYDDQSIVLCCETSKLIKQPQRTPYDKLLCKRLD